MILPDRSRETVDALVAELRQAASATPHSGDIPEMLERAAEMLLGLVMERDIMEYKIRGMQNLRPWARAGQREEQK